jgi:hypothetical protein
LSYCVNLWLLGRDQFTDRLSAAEQTHWDLSTAESVLDRSDSGEFDQAPVQPASGAHAPACTYFENPGIDVVGPRRRTDAE